MRYRTGRVHPSRRHDLCRSATSTRGAARRWVGVAQHRDGAEIESGTGTRRLSRLSPLQLSGRAPEALWQRGVADRALGRSRGARQLVSDAAARRRPALRGEKCRIACGSGEAGVSGVPAAADQSDRGRAHLPLVETRAAARSLRARHADVSRREFSQCPARAERRFGDSWQRAGIR